MIFDSLSHPDDHRDDHRDDRQDDRLDDRQEDRQDDHLDDRLDDRLDDHQENLAQLRFILLIYWFNIMVCHYIIYVEQIVKTNYFP